MKSILFLAVTMMLFSFTIWQPDFEVAKKTAAAKHELILLNFSGSDWCGPCIRMRREIFNDSGFSRMADKSLVLANADFPRKKNHQPNPRTKKQNNELAEKYNPEGKFPYTVLLNAAGKVLKTWDGMPDKNASQFTAEVKSICDANK